MLRPFTRYTLWNGYEALYRHLTDQPAVVPPPVGPRKTMPPVTGCTSSPTPRATPPAVTPPVSSTRVMPPGAEAVLQARDRVQALHELLFFLFEANELRMWLRFSPEGEAVIRALPGGSVRKAELMFKATDLLNRRGLVDAEFFDRLREHLPRQAAVIDHVRARWLGV